MKKKTCRWLDSNTWGGIQILDDKIYPCCGPSEPLYDEENLDYSKISIDELLEKRRVLQKDVMEGKACIGCDQIIEKEESDIVVDKISYLSIGLFSTCNLRCKYCYFTHEQLGDKLTSDRTHLLPFVSRLYNAGFLKDDLYVGVAGGEPTLLEDIPETCEFLEQNCSKSTIVLISNSSIENRTKKFTATLKNLKKIKKHLCTSIDSGTRNTYKMLRGRDLYASVCKNIINYAKNDVFNLIILKYILMFDHSNISDKDIFGFLRFFQKVLSLQKGKMALSIDCDLLSKELFDEKMVAAAGKLHYVATQILKTEVAYTGGGIVNYSKEGLDRIHRLEEYSANYKTMNKTIFERIMLLDLNLKMQIIYMKKLYKFMKFYIKEWKDIC